MREELCLVNPLLDFPLCLFPSFRLLVLNSDDGQKEGLEDMIKFSTFLSKNEN